MKEIEMIKGAKKIVEECTDVKTGENVLIITDTTMPLSIAETLAMACKERGAETIISIMSPLSVEGHEPPPTVAEAMKKAQVVFMVLSQGILHTTSCINAAKVGARGITLPQFTEEDLYRGPIEADFTENRKLAEKVAERLQRAKEARITTIAGTDIYLNLEGQGKGVKTFPYICRQPGKFCGMIFETNISPNVGKSQGIIICDGCISFFKPGLIPKEYVRAVVKDGMVTEISGGADAKKLVDALKALDDPMVHNIAELGIGLDPMSKLPKAKMTGSQSQDKGIYGTCHIGAGSNVTWGGNVKAATHYDFILYAPKIELDGNVLLENYQFNL
jgi:2,5-dihydroxypyridine 5,6-dioxygenase